MKRIEGAVYIRDAPRGATCDVHSWPDEGLGHRLIHEMHARYGKGGVNVCRECLLRARDSVRSKPPKTKTSPFPGSRKVTPFPSSKSR